MRRRRRRRVAARSGGFPALPLGGAPGHQHDHKLVHYVEGAHAHVTEGSRGVIVPCRRPAPEGGSTAAPASSWRLKNAQDEGISSGGFCSRCVEEEGELKSDGKAPVRKLGNGRGSAALRCDRGAAPTGAEEENLRQHKLDKPLANPRIKKEERRSQSFTGGDEFTAAARNRGGGVGENWCSSACSGVLRVQRGE
jgi:hypothetical protein